MDAQSRIYAASWKGATFNWNGMDVGYIVRFSPKDFKPTPLPDFAKAGDAELVKLLESPSHRTRLEAQRTLLRRGIDAPKALEKRPPSRRCWRGRQHAERLMGHSAEEGDREQRERERQQREAAAARKAQADAEANALRDAQRAAAGADRSDEALAEAEARAIQVVADSLKGSVSNPAQYLIAQKYLESLGTIATGADKVVFLPYEAAGTMGSLGAMKEMLTAQGK